MIKFSNTSNNLKELYTLDRFEALKGNLSEKDAHYTLIDFLRYNLDFTVHLLFGYELLDYQSLIIKNWFEKSFCMNTWARGSGKTVVYISDNQLLIEKDKGLISVQNLLPNIDFSQGERWIEIPDLYLWNGNYYAKTNRVLIQPKKECLRVTTKNGYSLDGSTNHLIKCLDKNKLTIIWKRFHELTTNDLVCISRNNTIDNNIGNIDLKEAYLAGLMVGDGSYTSKNPLSFTNADEELLQFVYSFDNPKIYQKKNTLAKEIRFCKRFSDYFLNKYNIQRCLSYNKTIPVSILASKNALKEFLKGLFDTNGYASKNTAEIELCSTSVELIKQVQVALLQFNIISTSRIKKTKSKFGKAYLLYIRGENAIKFYHNIGFGLTRKQDRLAQHLNKKNNTNIDVIPGLVEYANDIKKNTFAPLGKSKWKRPLKGAHLNRINGTYDLLDRYIKCFEEMGCSDPRLNNLKEIQTQNYFFDPVVKIEESIEDCIDFNIPDGESYWCNGFINHNSHLSAIFLLLYAIFYHNTKIVIASATFRSSRRIMEGMEKFLQNKSAWMLRQCFPEEIKRSTDLWQLKCSNGSIIRALPLNDKIRGERADVLLVDEYVSVPKRLYDEVLFPFLGGKSNMQEMLKLKRQEDYLIKMGAMTENDRLSNIAETTKKVILLTSASYEFEDCFKTHKQWIENSLNEKEDNKYFVSRLSYQATPSLESLMEEDVIKEAKSGGEHTPYFKKEFKALYLSGSDNFFSAKHMADCTIPDGETPCIKIFDKDTTNEYLLSIDPSFSSGKTSDFFAMSVFHLDNVNKRLTLVHNYASAGGELKNHIAYLYYLVTHFNIVLITADLLGGQGEAMGFNFIEAANQSHLFQENNISIKVFEAEFAGQEYEENIKAMRRNYNKKERVYCHRQKFNTLWIKEANEYLQHQIQNKKVWFASRICYNEDEFAKLSHYTMPINVYNNKQKLLTITEFLEEQDILIQTTKDQISLIEQRQTANGSITYDLPAVVKATKSENRARKDLYTTLLMATWIARCYWDYKDENIGKIESWKPFFLN